MSKLNIHLRYFRFSLAQEDVIDLEVLRDRLEYQMDDTDQNKECQAYFNSYLCELSERGTQSWF